MKSKLFATTAAVLAATTALVALLCLMGQGNLPVLHLALAAPRDAPTVTAVDPPSAPNDLDTPIVITGTGFTAGMTVTLGSTRLSDAGWVSATLLTATVPWGLGPGVYTLTVVNADGQSGSLPNAFTVTPGIGVWTSGGPYGGLVTRLAITSTTTTLLYAEMGNDAGIFRSRDGGDNWKMVRANVRYMAMDPLLPSTIYATDVGGNVYRSDNSGDTWNLPLKFSSRGLARIFPHPGISGTVYAGVSRGDPTNLEEGNLFKSQDRGGNWITWTNGLTDTNVTAMAFDPNDPLTMYVGTANGNVFRSGDAGLSWGFIGQPRKEFRRLVVNPFVPAELWASGEVSCDCSPGLWRYDSISWTQVLTRGGGSLVFSRNVSGTMWVASDPTVLTSTDGGQTWATFKGFVGGGGITALAVDPADEQIVYMGASSHGMYKTSDGGATLTQINDGLAGVVPTSLSPMPGNPGTVYAKSEIAAGAFKTNNGGASWLQVLDEPTQPMGSAIQVDPITPTRVYLIRDEWIGISSDGGGTWNFSLVLPAPPQYQGSVVDCRALLVNPALPGRLVMGVAFWPSKGADYIGGGIYTSTDYGESWTYVDVGRPISTVAALAYDPVSPTVVYAGTSWYWANGSGNVAAVLKSTDGGKTWPYENYSRDGLEDCQRIESIAVEPVSPHRVFVACDGNLRVSTNSGQTFTRTQSNADLLAFGPGNPPVLYLGTWQGLYRTWDGEQTSYPVEGALGSVPIHALAVVTATGRTIVYASTAGGLLTTTTSLRSLAAGGETLLDPGAYRYTTRWVGVQSGNISGPATGIVQHANTFTALVNPTTATVPIRYEWQATDQSPVTHTTGSLSDSATFTWNVPGPQVITVTATNDWGAISFTHVVTINTPLSTVDIGGLTKGFVNAAYVFTATASPIMATLPITYVWQATGLPPVTHIGSLSDTVSFTWNTAGTKVIAVTASNGFGAPVADVHTITVERYQLYLPLILRSR